MAHLLNLQSGIKLRRLPSCDKMDRSNPMLPNSRGKGGKVCILLSLLSVVFYRLVGSKWFLRTKSIFFSWKSNYVYVTTTVLSFTK